jgi:hypothetical protein
VVYAFAVSARQKCKAVKHPDLISQPKSCGENGPDAQKEGIQIKLRCLDRHCGNDDSDTPNQKARVKAHMWQLIKHRK